jgi:AcrR family transcriptional regulator
MAPVLDLPRLVRGLPPAPPPQLGPALDAAARCFARHGITRTAMTDIGRELGISRSGIYRQLGSIERAARLLVAREVHDLVARRLAVAVEATAGPQAIIVLLDEVVAYARDHPVLTKVLADEPEIIGPFLVTDLPTATAQVAEMVEPVLDRAMAAGLIARQDARSLAEWLVRLAVVLILDPPGRPVRPLLEQLLLPALDPRRGGSDARR